MEEQYQTKENFVKKVFGIFCNFICIIAVYILVILIMRPTNPMPKKLEDDKSSIKGFARNFTYLVFAIIIALGCLVVITSQVAALRNYNKFNNFLGYLYCVALTYIAGYISYTSCPNTVLTSFLCTIILSIGLARYGNKIIDNMNRTSQIGNALTPIVGIMSSFIVVIVLLTYVNPFSSGQKPTFMRGFLILIFMTMTLFFFIIDVWAITNGKYYRLVNKEDHIYGSTKLFADFILIFTIITQLISSDGGGAEVVENVE